jgi:glucan phosphoethanolaminetransferase (alkaline phosphatase superfamily)
MQHTWRVNHVTTSSGTKGILGIIGGILALVSLAMAWFEASFFSVSGFGVVEMWLHVTETNLQNAGYLVLIGGILALLFGILLVADVMKFNNRRTGYTIILIGGVLCVLGLIAWLFFASQMHIGFSTVNLFEIDNLTIGMGFILAIAGTLLITIEGYLGVKKR